MLAKRVIPTMLVRGRTLVKGERFRGDRSVGHAMQAARVHAKRGVDELVILDIGATADGRGPDLDMVREMSQELFVPLTVGGGVRTLQDIDALLRAGADKVSVCSVIRNDPAFMHDAASRFGKQAIVAVIEHDDNENVFRSIELKWLAEHCGEIVVQCRNADGRMSGYAIDTIGSVCDAVDVPVIASGGCSGPEDMLRAIQAGADAVAAGALFLFTDYTPKSCAQYLRDHGVEVRLETA